MSRLYTDPVEVRRGDDAPAQFLWRGRLYVVRDVLSHWVEVAPWWSSAEAHALLGDAVPEPRSPEQPIDGSDGFGVAVVDDAEREIWRVEATSGRSSGTGVYDLCFDSSSADWTLSRAID